MRAMAHGILAPAARHRAEVIPKAKADVAVVGVSHEDGEAAQRAPRSRNYTWAELMRRVFAVDVLECPDCRGRMRILAAIHSLSAIRAILECLGLPPRPPPITPADPDPGRPDLDDVC